MQLSAGDRDRVEGRSVRLRLCLYLAFHSWHVVSIWLERTQGQVFQIEFKFCHKRTFDIEVLWTLGVLEVLFFSRDLAIVISYLIYFLSWFVAIIIIS